MNKTIIKKLGDILTILNPFLGIVLIYLILGFRGLVTFLVTYGIGNLLCQIVKGICDSNRPREGEEYQTIKIHGYSHKDGESCCSGHAISAALPTYFILMWVGFLWFIPFFIISSVCAWTRVKVKAHWLFDVILSNIIALLLNIVVIYLISII